MTVTENNLIRVARHSQQWLRERPTVVDVAFACLVFVIELIDLFASSEDPGVHREPDLVAVVLIAFGALALIRRRKDPIAVLIAAATTMIPFYLRDYGSFMSVIGLSAFYAAAAHASNRTRAWVTIVVAGVTLCTMAAFTLLDRPNGFVYSGAATMSTYICVATFVGVIARNREQIFMKAEARATRAEADRAAAAERAASQERLRIARELHDVVAHGMSVISVQAAAAQEIARNDPDRAIELMKTVENTGRQSLDEMRRMLGILRNGEHIADGSAAARAPQPSLADIEETIAHCRDAGLATEFTISGEPQPLSPGLELTIFRIVQEALTNVMKHGGSAATASVEISYRFTTVLVRITDTGRGLAAPANETGAGNGLRGMRERVGLYDGQFLAGAQPGGGYQISAVLPFGTAGRPGVPSAEAQPTGRTA